MTFWQSEIQIPPAKIRFMVQKKKSNPKPQEGQLLSKEALCSRELTGRVDAWKAFSAFRDQVWITCAVHFRVHDSIWKAAVKEIGTRSTKNTMDIKNTKAVVTNKPQSGYYIYCLSHTCRLVWPRQSVITPKFSQVFPKHPAQDTLKAAPKTWTSPDAVPGHWAKLWAPPDPAVSWACRLDWCHPDPGLKKHVEKKSEWSQIQRQADSKILGLGSRRNELIPV